jgi:chorismate mutase
LSQKVRAIRGATTVSLDGPEEILKATEKLVREMVLINQVKTVDIASVWMTMTADLTSTFPARCLRNMEGWTYVPVMCAQEIAVKGALERCIRVMIHVNTDRSQKEIQHVYLNGTDVLRPDLHLTK